MSEIEDRKWMRRALDMAHRGIGLASPNPPVGCVLVRDGGIVGRGMHEYASLLHAEIRALEQAGSRAGGSTAYLTLEPCSHYGRTPPCAGRLIEAGIRRVVVGAVDPNPKVSGKGIEALRSAGIEVEAGVLHEEALALIEPFACSVTQERPLIVSKAGMSLDGRIATRLRKSNWISSVESRAFGQSLRLCLDAILVGCGTILLDDPELTYRGSQRKGRPLLRVVLDSRLRTPPSARILQSITQAPVLFFCKANASKLRRQKLESLGAEVIGVPATAGGLDLDCVLLEMVERRILGLLIEGGGEVHWSFLSAGLVDKFYFIVAPLVLGGREAVPAVGGSGYGTIDESLRFKIRRSFYCGPDLILESYPQGSRSNLSPWLSSETRPCAARASVRSSTRR